MKKLQRLSSKMADRESKIEEFVAITGASREIAKSLLTVCNDNLEMAINMQMEGVQVEKDPEPLASNNLGDQPGTSAAASSSRRQPGKRKYRWESTKSKNSMKWMREKCEYNMSTSSSSATFFTILTIHTAQIFQADHKHLSKSPSWLLIWSLLSNINWGDFVKLLWPS